jgi:predicted Zn-ribbon and HTH transcriptional regulator
MSKIDGYCEKYIIVIKAVVKRKSDKDLLEIINRIYTEGFEDGHNEKIKDLKSCEQCGSKRLFNVCKECGYEDV